MYQRAADVGVGLIYNIASYSLLIHLIARETELKPGRFIHSIGDLHIYCDKGNRGRFYENHLNELRKELQKKNQDYIKMSSRIEQVASFEAFEDNLGRRGQFDHVPGLLKLLSRNPFDMPRLKIATDKSLFDLSPKDIQLVGYKHHPLIKFDVAI